MKIKSHKALFLSILLHVIVVLLIIYLINFNVDDVKKECKMCHVSLCMIQNKEVKKNIIPVQKHKEIVAKKIVEKKEVKDFVEEAKLIKKRVIKNKIKKREVTKKIVKKRVKKVVVKKESLVPVIKEKQESKETKNVLHVEPSKSPAETLHVEDYELHYLQDNIRQIEQLITDHLIYPRKARIRNITGIVHLKFTITPDSKVINLMVLEQDYEILGRSAIKTIKSIGRKFPPPTKNLTISVPIKFMLK